MSQAAYPRLILLLDQVASQAAYPRLILLLDQVASQAAYPRLILLLDQVASQAQAAYPRLNLQISRRWAQQDVTRTTVILGQPVLEIVVPASQVKTSAMVKMEILHAAHVCLWTVMAPDNVEMGLVFFAHSKLLGTRYVP